MKLTPEQIREQVPLAIEFTAALTEGVIFKLDPEGVLMIEEQDGAPRKIRSVEGGVLFGVLMAQVEDYP